MRDKKRTTSETYVRMIIMQFMTHHSTRLWNTLYSRRSCIQEEARHEY